MALKSDRELRVYDVTYFLNEVAEKGAVLVHNGDGSGAAMDQNTAAVTIPTTAFDVMSGVPVGILLDDFVVRDLTKDHLNFQKNEAVVGSKATILKQGWIVTDNVSGSPVRGDPLHYNEIGQFTNETDSPPLGRFGSAKDADGYAKVEVNLP